MNEVITWTADRFNLAYIAHFLSDDEAVFVFDELEAMISGDVLTKSRETLLFGDHGLTYEVNISNSAYVSKPNPWPPVLLILKQKLEIVLQYLYKCDINFNVCVGQRYPSGKVAIAPHRDKEMTKGTRICGISLGQTRTLNMAKYNTAPLLSLPLENGSLYVFNPPTNDHYSHSIKRDSSKGVRWSLTFRNYVK